MNRWLVIVTNEYPIVYKVFRNYKSALKYGCCLILRRMKTHPELFDEEYDPYWKPGILDDIRNKRYKEALDYYDYENDLRINILRIKV
jgi:hypothetical protein